MRGIKVLTVVGLAVALVAVAALAQAQRQIKLTPPSNANGILLIAEKVWEIAEAKWTKDGQPIGDIKELTGQKVALIDVGFGNQFGTVGLIIGDVIKEPKLNPPKDANDILIVAKEDWVIKEAWWTQGGSSIIYRNRIQQITDLVGKRLASLHVPKDPTQAPELFYITYVVPTLTEWGLIALGLLLAGSLAVMIRRRFARPAAAA